MTTIVNNGGSPYHGTGAYLGNYPGGPSGVLIHPSFLSSVGTNYVLLFNTNGDTFLNAVSGRTMYFRIASSTVMSMNSSSLGIGGGTIDSKAILTLNSTIKGFLPPRMTTAQKTAISSPTEGLIVYDSTLHKLCIYTGAAWETITSV